MKLGFVFSLLCGAIFSVSAQAQQQTFSGELKAYDQNGRLSVDQMVQFLLDPSQINFWSNTIPPYGMSITGIPYAPVAPQPIPRRGSAPLVASITDTPTLVFYDDFNYSSQSAFLSEISPQGPITGSVKWINKKADGLGFGGGGNIAAFFQPVAPNSDYYIQQPDHVDLNAHTWAQTATSNGDGLWFEPFLGSAAFAGPGAVNGQPTGHWFTAPFTVEVAGRLPQLSASDAATAAGLWPGIAFYSVPGIATPTGDAYEIDVLEAYSVDAVNRYMPSYHISTHIWSPGGSNLGGYTYFAKNIFNAQAWHVWTTHVGVSTTDFYCDGQLIYSAPTNYAGPWYITIDGALGGPGWDICLNPAQAYTFSLSYVGVWSH